MARKTRKTGRSVSEWRRIFADVARKCREESKRRGIKYQQCIREELAKYR